MKSAIIIVLAFVLISGISIASISAQSQTDIPAWVKGVASFWVEGNIDDSEFGEALSFLIEQGIIKVDMPQQVNNSELEQKLIDLESENLELKIAYAKMKVTNSQLHSENTKLKFESQSISTEKTDTSQLTLQELKEQAVSWNYKDILRNEEYYKGKIIFLTGSISVVDERDDVEGWVLLSVYTSKTSFGSWFEDLMYIWYDGDRLLYEDIIEVYLHVDEVLERESMLGPSYIYYPIGTAKHVTCISC